MGLILGLVFFFHVFVSVALVVLVLLQQGKGADAGAAFGAGSGASGTLFGAAGSGSFLSRLTSVAVTVFFLTSLTLTYLVSHRSHSAHQSVLDKEHVMLSQAKPIKVDALKLSPQEQKKK